MYHFSISRETWYFSVWEKHIKHGTYYFEGQPEIETWSSLTSQPADGEKLSDSMVILCIYVCIYIYKVRRSLFLNCLVDSIDIQCRKFHLNGLNLEKIYQVKHLL